MASELGKVQFEYLKILDSLGQIRDLLILTLGRIGGRIEETGCSGLITELIFFGLLLLGLESVEQSEWVIERGSIVEQACIHESLADSTHQTVLPIHRLLLFATALLTLLQGLVNNLGRLIFDL
jgi:hypothetical protein